MTHNATCETSPWILWVDAVLCEARVSHDDSRPHRQRLQLWFRSGEPVWMAANGLKQLVRGDKRATLEQQDGVSAIRQAIAKGILNGR